MISGRHALLAAICIAWILPGLIGHDPWKSEEATTFGVVYEVLQSKSWLVPMLAGAPHLVEPPFFHLTAAASAALFSPPLSLHDAARLVSGFYMALTFVFCGLAGRTLNGEGFGTVAALLLLGCFGLVLRSHELISDTATLCGFAMGYYGVALCLYRPAVGGFWIGTGLGLIFMTQGVPEAAVFFAIVLMTAVARPWRRRHYALTAIVAFLAALPWLAIWPALLYQRSPDLFNQWLWVYNLARLTGLHGAGFAYYARILPWYAWPVWPIALWVLWRERAALGRPAVLLPCIGFAVTFACLGVSSERRELHALPLLVPLALLATVGAATLRRGAANAWYWFSAMTFTFFVLVGWFYWTGLELGVPSHLHAHLHRMQPGYTPGFKALPFALGLAYTAAWFSVLIGLPRDPERPVFTWAAGITTVWALLAILFVGWVNAGKSYRAMIASLERALPAHYDCIGSRDIGEPQRAMLHYFGGIVTQREKPAFPPPHCTFMLVQGHAHVEVPPRGEWHKVWEGSRPGDKDERFRLYRRGGRSG